MKKIAYFVILTLLVCATAACNTRRTPFVPGDAVYKPAHAEGFTVYAAGERSHAILVTDPWQGASGVEQWVFVSGGGEAPPANFAGTVLREPARRIVCMSSSYVAFLGELGVADRIVGVSGAQFITDADIAARFAAGDIADVGYDGNLDFERLAALKPDLMLIYGVSSGDDAMTGKLREMGVPYVFVGEYLEESPQGKAEWIVPIARMCGVAEKGEARFSAISRDYDELRLHAAELAAGLEARPGVMLNAPYRDVWYVPGDDSYMVRLIRDAGGRYVCRGVGGRDTRPIDIEDAYLAMERADFWLDTNHYSTLASLLADNPRFAATRPVREGHVWNNNARTTPAGGSDFWESGAVRPDLVLLDLVMILHPEAFPADHVPYYYRRLE